MCMCMGGVATIPLLYTIKTLCNNNNPLGVSFHQASSVMRVIIIHNVLWSQQTSSSSSSSSSGKPLT
jgi:hypothetical protein